MPIGGCPAQRRGSRRVSFTAVRLCSRLDLGSVVRGVCRALVRLTAPAEATEPATAEATAAETATPEAAAESSTEATAEPAASAEAIAAAESSTATEAARVALEAAARLLLPLRRGGTAARALPAPGGVLLPVAGVVALDRAMLLAKWLSPLGTPSFQVWDSPVLAL